MTSPLRFGVLGAGRTVKRRVIPGIHGASDAVLQAVASRRPGVAASVADKYEIPRAYESYETLLADSSIDAVWITSTGDTRAHWTVCAAEAGKHVLCEKPLALTHDEAETASAACRENGVLLQEACAWRHHPRTGRVLQMIREGVIGRLRLIGVHFSFHIHYEDRRLEPEHGGGVLRDLGCHGLSAARLLTGAEPNRLSTHATFHQKGADSAAVVALSFPDDVLASIDCSFEAAYRCEAEVVGTRGRMVLPDAFLPPKETSLTVYGSDEPETTPESTSFPNVNQYVDEVHNFCTAVAAGTLQPPAEDGLADLRLLERIQHDTARRRNTAPA